MSDMIEMKLICAVAQSWCQPETKNKEMDTVLASVIVKKVLLVFNDLQSENEKLKKALERLCYLHTMEMEGLESGMPTSEEWMDAVENAENALKGADNDCLSV